MRFLEGFPLDFLLVDYLLENGAGNKRKLEQKIENGKPI